MDWPALAIAQSRRPKRSSVSPTIRVHRLPIRDVGLEELRGRARARARAGDAGLFERRDVAADERDVGAALRELDGDRAPDSAARAGDERDFAGRTSYRRSGRAFDLDAELLDAGEIADDAHGRDPCARP